MLPAGALRAPDLTQLAVHDHSLDICRQLLHYLLNAILCLPIL